MNLTPFSRLVWKEYRAARAFWGSLVVLTFFLQALIVGTSNDLAWNVLMVYTFALGAPAFFAVGCAGAAFAIEREEGTYEFLRAAPATPRDVLTSKLAVAALATMAMFGVLWLLAMAFAGGRLPEPDQLRGSLGLWLLAALEGLAWGTLFSLRSARPLAAICLAMVTATTVVHVLAWTTAEYSPGVFELAPYLASVPQRFAVVAVVLALDVYLGLRWLDEGGRLERLPRAMERRAAGVLAVSPAPEQVAASWLNTADRGSMLGRLLWQHCRQSGWLMLATTGIYVALAILVGQTIGLPMAVLMAIMAPIMGCFVFRADQEQRRHRYFVEHNVPPRYVWLTRQAPWIALVTGSSLIVVLGWVGPARLATLWSAAWSVTNIPWMDQGARLPEYLEVPPIGLALAWVAVSYAAGQWASMMIRSGLLAGLCGLVLGCVLGGWVILMDAWHVSWLWSVAPIPLVLLWATWWRAPDWAHENTSWAARRRAAAAVLVPAGVLLLAVPWYRVYSLPDALPGFEPARYLATFTPEAKATAELYRRANDLYASNADNNNDSPRWLLSPSQVVQTDNHRRWLKLNAEPLALVLEASGRPECAFGDPRTLTDSNWLHNSSPLVWLVVASGRELEHDGQLDAALDRYFAALTVISQLSDPTLFQADRSRLRDVELVFMELCHWANQQGQTTERIQGAIERLEAIDSNLLRIDDAIKANYVIASRYVSGDTAAQSVLFGYSRNGRDLAPSILWPKLTPWEADRAQRALNLRSQHSLARLQGMRTNLAAGEGVIDELPTVSNWVNSNYIYSNNEDWQDVQLPARPWWLDTITPDLDPLIHLGNLEARMLAAFEARRSGTILLLAIEAYRIDHNDLPDSLDKLVGKYLDQLPLDPYSGKSFVYYAAGLPAPTTPLERAQLEQANQLRHSIQTDWPCVWCTGPTLAIAEWCAHVAAADENSPEPDRLYFCTLHRSPVDWAEIPIYLAWARGNWFPIPKRP